MNERIKQLARQAGLEPCIIFKNYAVSEKSITIEQEKFAQLIVKECMSLVSEPGPDMNDTERGILAQIKQHFGVEE